MVARGEGSGEREEIDEEIKSYKLPVIKQMSHGGKMCGTENTVNNKVISLCGDSN